MIKYVNGQEVPMTAEEIADFEAHAKKREAELKARADEKKAQREAVNHLLEKVQLEQKHASKLKELLYVLIDLE